MRRLTSSLVPAVFTVLILANDVTAQVQAAWVARHDDPGVSLEQVADIVVDAAGNVFVTGSSGTACDLDCQVQSYLTVGYGPDGDELWTARFDAGHGGLQRARAIALDGAGNVLVSGTSWGGKDTRTDYATVKYAPDGALIWVARYHSPRIADDEATALVADAASNVYVTGRSGADYLTVKYDSAGNELWNARWKGPNNETTSAVAIAVEDATGSVLVTGWSCNGDDCEYVTIKYDAAGDEQWVAAFGAGGNDRATDLTIDNLGNVYVTGHFWDAVANNSDYATVKYDPAGEETWVARYDGPGRDQDSASAIAVDADGSVYVTGESWSADGGCDYATVKYDADGNEERVVRYDGAGEESTDRASDLRIDQDGNLYVAGRSGNDAALVTYDSTMTQSWVALVDGPGAVAAVEGDLPRLSIDGSGAVHVAVTTSALTAGSGGADFGTAKLGPAGEETWSRVLDQPGSAVDSPAAIVVDASGDILVAGGSLGIDSDYTTVKYSPAGEELWVARYDGPASQRDNATALAVDGAGNILVTGVSPGKDTSEDYATVRYDAQGRELWVRRYDGTGNGRDTASSIGIDGDGNVLVLGTSRGTSATSFDYATVKYAPNGEELWVARFAGDGSVRDTATALAVDGAGNIYVTGASCAGSVCDYVTIKYAPNGDELWVATLDRGNKDEATAVGVDGEGNVYVAGRSDNDYVTVQYDSDGQEGWVARYDGPGGSNDRVSALALDGSGNVFVTGRSQGLPETGVDFATIKYSASGEELWVARYNGPANGEDVPTAIVVDAAGDIVVTGRACDEEACEYATIRYDSEGNEVWVARHAGPVPDDDVALGLAVGGGDEGTVYVVGHTRDGDTGWDYTTVKYVEVTGARFRRGDVDVNARLDVTDAIVILGFLFLADPTELECEKAADTTDSGALEIADPVRLLRHLFSGGEAPPPPFDDCGLDPLADDLPCESFSPCDG